MFGNRGRELKRTDELRRRVYDADEFVDVLPVTQGLNASGRGASSDGDQRLALPAYFLDALSILMGSDRSFDEPNVVRPLQHRAGSFGEVSDVQRCNDSQKFVFGIEQT